MKNIKYLIGGVWVLALVFVGMYFSGVDLFQEEKIQEKKIQEEKQEPITVDLVAFGDFMLHQPQLNVGKTEEGYDFKPVFRYLQENHIEKADLALINLETTLTDGSRGYTTFPVFTSPKEVAKNLKDVGFDIISTANNHSFDGGLSGVEFTIDALKEQGLDVIGSQKEEPQPFVKEVKGMKIGFLSYTYGLNGFDQTMLNGEKPYAVNLISDERVVEDTKKLKDLGVDAMVAFVHWGEEYHQAPTEAQVHYFNLLADNGVILTLGSHPHISQGVSSKKVGQENHFVAYSMGNFVSNQRREYMNNRRPESGLMVKARLEKGIDGKTRVTGFDPSPTYVDKYSDGNGLHFEVIPVEDVLNGEIEFPRKESIQQRLEESMGDFRELIPPEMVLEM